jgi:spore maturation protein CgeB
MNLYIINTPELPCLGTLRYTFKKLSMGFLYNGYDTREITTQQELSTLDDTENNIFLISNHGVQKDINNSNSLDSLSKFKKTVKILWFFHDFLSLHKEMPFDNWILTGEHFRKTPRLQSHIKAYTIQNKLQNYVPLTFSSFLNPEDIGKNIRSDIWDIQFVGNYYKSGWTSMLKNSYIRNTPPEIPEQERIYSFNNSICSAGFHSDANILNYCMVERVPEAISLGCISLTDNPAATEATDGISILVNSFEELEENISYYRKNKEERIKLQTKGLKWSKSCGTYKHVSDSFINKIKELK